MQRKKTWTTGRSLWPVLVLLVLLAARATLGAGVQVERISVSSNEEQANESSALAAISGNGRFVAFSSPANNLVSGDTNVDRTGAPVADVLVRSRRTETREGDKLAGGNT